MRSLCELTDCSYLSTASLIQSSCGASFIDHIVHLGVVGDPAVLWSFFIAAFWALEALYIFISCQHVVPVPVQRWRLCWAAHAE